MTRSHFNNSTADVLRYREPMHGIISGVGKGRGLGDKPPLGLEKNLLDIFSIRCKNSQNIKSFNEKEMNNKRKSKVVDAFMEEEGEKCKIFSKILVDD